MWVKIGGRRLDAELSYDRAESTNGRPVLLADGEPMDFGEFMARAQDWGVAASESRDFVRWFVGHNPRMSVSAPRYKGGATRSWDYWVTGARENIPLPQWLKALEFLGFQVEVKKK